MKNQLITENLKFLNQTNSNNSLSIDFPNFAGSIDIHKNIINKDIVVFKNDFSIKKDSTIEYTSKEKALCMDFTLEGEVDYFEPLTNQKIFKTSNTMFVKYIPSTHNILKTKKDTKGKNIGIVIKDDFLENYLLKKLKNKEVLKKNYSNNISTLLKKSKTNAKTSILLNEIYNCPFEGTLEDIFLQSKVYEIIYNEFNDILQAENSLIANNIKLSKEDIKSLIKAKSLICEDKCFISLSKLSRKVALNEFKLKYGFKHLFNTSPGAMMLEYRMIEAKKLLELSELNIQEVSKLVGYKYAQSFTNAFYKHFKILPKDIMQTRKYYY